MRDSKKKCKRWPLKLLAGDRVLHKMKPMRVVPAYVNKVPRGCVPIVHENEYEVCPDVFECVPADELTLT